MSNRVFGKIMENVRKYWYYYRKLLIQQETILLKQANCHPTKLFLENLLAIDMKKTRNVMNNYFYIVFSIFVNSKVVIYEFWHDFIKKTIVKDLSYVTLISVVS